MDSEWVVARGSSGGGGGSGGNDNATVLFYFFFIIAHCATIIIIYARIYLWMELNNCVDDVDVIGFFWIVAVIMCVVHNEHDVIVQK